MIDPGIWESEQVQSLTPHQFKLYVYLISNADDEGRQAINFMLLSSAAFPLDPTYLADECRRDMEAIAKAELIILYKDERGKTYAAHPNWTRYQYIQKKQKSHHPAPPGEPYVIEQTEANTSIGDDEKAEYTDTVPVSYHDHTGTISVSPNRIEKNRIEKNTSSASAVAEAVTKQPGTPPRKPASLKDPLAADYEQAFTHEVPLETWKSIPQERKHLVDLAKRTRRTVATTPYETESELAGAIMAEFSRQRRTGRGDYWRKAPFIPSALTARWDQVIESLRQNYDSQPPKDEFYEQYGF